MRHFGNRGEGLFLPRDNICDVRVYRSIYLTLKNYQFVNFCYVANIF